MILFLGDIHGDFNILRQAHELAHAKGASAVIQVGDFGFEEGCEDDLERAGFQIPTFVIDGNHENFDYLEQFSGISEIATNVFYVPRGTVHEIDGRKIAFLGGACSVDKYIRLERNYPWYPQEVVTDEDIARLDGVDSVDLMVTHVPPQWVIQKHFDPMFLVVHFGLPIDWKDPSADRVEKVWRRLNMPPLICGHMHRSVTDRNVRILNIAECVGL